MVNASRGAHGSTASIHNLHPMMGSEMIARRSMLHMSRALCPPDAEDRVRDESPEGHRAIATPRKMSGRQQAYFRELMLEVKAAPRSAPHSSQALKEKIMAQHVKLFNAVSPCDSTIWTRSTQSRRGLELSVRSLA